ncbi:Acetyltransferase (GNAT) domain-containing protein [Clostridium sp. DSM 8431]|uniref:GNAT family N-acetyltransferase n=1 Tax=Clostridium sp. DSM 8431 TaxID=1761781 RepID=UPI0008E2F6A0|nr:GNAT family protein [Clostridium sp. DSM 8431]SFU56245.1 Acetyltransferase (GNAT) domain-containing protein [Clostridium sp. DSM 8431]
MKSVRAEINKTMPIIGEKVILNNITLHDLVKVRLCCNREGFEKFTSRPVYKLKEEDSYNVYSKVIKDDRICILGIYEKSEGTIMGYITIYDYNDRNKAIEIGYYLIEAYRNKGYMKETVNLTLKILFHKLKLNKVTAQTGSYNDSSNALLKSCGFKLDGVLRQHHELHGKLYDDYLYSILNEEF